MDPGSLRRTAFLRKRIRFAQSAPSKGDQFPLENPLALRGGGISVFSIKVIYQTAEDGLADTIKPRLTAAGADCSRVLVIDESRKELTLRDERMEQAVN